jgi:hypothetical protein
VKSMAQGLATLTLAFHVSSGWAPATAPPARAQSDRTALLFYTAFRCSVYAEMAGKPISERERLFRLGYDNGKAFLDGVRDGAISEEEFRKAPMGVTRWGSGPTTEFGLGRIYEKAAQDAFDGIVKHDASGVPLPISKWISDDELTKMRAETEYRTRSCALLK